jgi:hypothetical protein
MATVSERAVEKGLAGLRDLLASSRNEDWPSHERAVQAILEAAEPLIRAEERERIKEALTEFESSLHPDPIPGSEGVYTKRAAVDKLRAALSENGELVRFEDYERQRDLWLVALQDGGEKQEQLLAELEKVREELDLALRSLGEWRQRAGDGVARAEAAEKQLGEARAELAKVQGEAEKLREEQRSALARDMLDGILATPGDEERPENRTYADGGQPGGTCACGRTPDPGIKPGGGCWCTEENRAPGASEWKELWLTRPTPDADAENYSVWGPADLPETVPHPVDGETRRYVPALEGPEQPKQGGSDGH